MARKVQLPKRKIVTRRGIPRPRPLKSVSRPFHPLQSRVIINKRKHSLKPKSRPSVQGRPQVRHNSQIRPQHLQHPKPPNIPVTTFSWLVIDGNKLDSEVFRPVSIQGHTSNVWTNSTNTLIVKKTIRYFDYSVFEREIYWLRLLNDEQISWAPKLLQVSKPFIVMENVGTNVTKHIMPSNWSEQIKTIESDMKRLNLRHNDIKGNEILVKSGKLYLIDFQWASLNDDWSCKGKFSARSKPHGLFNNIQTVIKSVLK